MALPTMEQAVDELTSVVIVRISADGVVQHANAGFRRMLDGTRLSPWQLFSQPRLDELLARTPGADGSVHHGRMTAGDSGGTMRTLTGTVYRDGPTLLLFMGYDIDELERLPAQLLELNDQLDEAERELVRANRNLAQREASTRRLSLTDSLTGVGNRRDFDRVLAEEMTRARHDSRPLSLVLLDLDCFKAVNDTWGHQAGDQVLQVVAGLLSENVRQPDHVARTGGEEFSVLMPGLGAVEAQQVAERLRSILASHPVGELPPVTASFGVATLTQADTFDNLYTRVDRAMYAAKQAGRNRVWPAQ